MLTRGKASKDKLIDWRYLETDKDTKQLIINVGTKTIDCVLKPGTHNLQPGAARFLKQLVNSHEGVPKHLHGLLNLEGHVRWITRSDHFISVEQKNDPTKLAWYFNACCDTYERPVGAAKMKIGGPYKNNGTLILQFKNEFFHHTVIEAQKSAIKRKRVVDDGRAIRLEVVRTRKRVTEEQNMLQLPLLTLSDMHEDAKKNSIKLTSKSTRVQDRDPILNGSDPCRSGGLAKVQRQRRARLAIPIIITRYNTRNSKRKPLEETTETLFTTLDIPKFQQTTRCGTEQLSRRQGKRRRSSETDNSRTQTSQDDSIMQDRLEASEALAALSNQGGMILPATDDHQLTAEESLRRPEGHMGLDARINIGGEKELQGENVLSSPEHFDTSSGISTPITHLYGQQHYSGHDAQLWTSSGNGTQPAIPLNMYASLNIHRKGLGQLECTATDRMKSPFSTTSISSLGGPSSDTDGGLDEYRISPAIQSNGRYSEPVADDITSRIVRVYNSSGRGVASMKYFDHNGVSQNKLKLLDNMDNMKFHQEFARPLERPTSTSYHQQQHQPRHVNPHRHTLIHTTYSSEPDTRRSPSNTSQKRCTRISFRRSSGKSDVIDNNSSCHSDGGIHTGEGIGGQYPDLDSLSESYDSPALTTPPPSTTTSKQLAHKEHHISLVDGDHILPTSAIMQSMATSSATTAATTAMNVRVPINSVLYPQLRTVSVRSPRKLLTHVPISIPPTGTFADLISFVIPAKIQLPADMQWSVRSSNLLYQYMPQARVSETILGVEHAEVVIMTERCTDIQLEDFDNIEAKYDY